MKPTLKHRDMEAIEFFFSRGETTEYISEIIDVPVYFIKQYAESEMIFLAENQQSKSWAMEAWSEYRQQEKLTRYDVNDLNYKVIRKAFVDGFMKNH